MLLNQTNKRFNEDLHTCHVDLDILDQYEMNYLFLRKNLNGYEDKDGYEDESGYIYCNDGSIYDNTCDIYYPQQYVQEHDVTDAYASSQLRSHQHRLSTVSSKTYLIHDTITNDIIKYEVNKIIDMVEDTIAKENGKVVKVILNDILNTVATQSETTKNAVNYISDSPTEVQSSDDESSDDESSDDESSDDESSGNGNDCINDVCERKKICQKRKAKDVETSHSIQTRKRLCINLDMSTFTWEKANDKEKANDIDTCIINLYANECSIDDNIPLSSGSEDWSDLHNV